MMDFNLTDVVQLSQPGLLAYFTATFYGLMTLLTIVLNSFALFVLHRWRHEFEEVSRKLFRSLAIVNMICGVSIGIFVGFLWYFYQENVSELLCWLVPSIGIFMMFSSTYHVALMNLQRYLAISYPFRYIRIATAKRLNILIAVMDFVFIGFSTAFFPVPQFPFTDFVKSWCRSRSFLFLETDNITFGRGAYIISAINGLLFAVPFGSLTYTNIRLLIIAGRMSRRRHDVFPATSDQAPANANSSTSGLKGLRTVFIITGLYYVSVIPLFVVMSLPYFDLGLSGQINDKVLYFSNTVLMCSCWWNVPVYMSTSSKVRERALELWRNINCCKRAQ